MILTDSANGRSSVVNPLPRRLTPPKSKFLSVTAGYSGFELVAWAAESRDQDYTEFNYWLAYAYEWKAFTFSFGYTYLDFETDDADDHKISSEIAFAFGDGFEFAVAGTYSDESDGAFYEATLAREIEFIEELSLLPFGTLGFNDAYIAEGHSGLNHLSLGLELSCQLCEHVSLAAFLAGSLEIDSDKNHHADDALLKDLLYGGLSLSVVY